MLAPSDAGAHGRCAAGRPVAAGGTDQARAKWGSSGALHPGARAAAPVPIAGTSLADRGRAVAPV